MAKIGTIVSQDRLKASIQEAEKNGPLANPGTLYLAVAGIYNKDRPAELPEITHSIVMSRIEKWQIVIKTQPGHRGRVAGQEVIRTTPGVYTDIDDLKSVTLQCSEGCGRFIGLLQGDIRTKGYCGYKCLQCRGESDSFGVTKEGE